MAEPTDASRDFVLQLEKALTTRRLYAPHMAPYREASERLLEKARAAAAGDGFTLRFGPTDLFSGKTSLVHRPKREESFFFPLYRDGLREMTVGPEVSAAELEALLTAFQAEEKRLLGPSDDTVTYLWRCDLTSITYSAIDGIGDQEGDEGAEDTKDDYRSLVADLTARIQDPGPPMTGQSYAFLVDADVKVAETDFHYESTTTHRTFEDNPTVLHLTPAEAQGLRGELQSERETELIGRFTDILFVMLGNPGRAVSGAGLAPVFLRLLEGYWAAADFTALRGLASRLGGAARGVPDPENRAAARGVLDRFLNPERLAATLDLLKQGALGADVAETIWTLAGAPAFPMLVEAMATLSDGPVRAAVTAYVQREAKAKPELLRGLLAAPEVKRVRGALALVDERLESFYARELLALAGHADEAIRLKGLAAAGRLGGPEAAEVLWKALHADPSPSVRLFAFRIVGASPPPGIGERLLALVSAPTFAERPAFERDKFVRLLGRVAPDRARPLFESWVPARKWLWQPKDTEAAELAFAGLASCGGEALAHVKAAAAGGGKLGEAAARVLAARDARGPADATIPPGGLRPAAPRK